MNRLDVRRSSHDALLALCVSLAEEFSGRVPAGTVIRFVADARERLLAAGVRAGLVAAVESTTRVRLQQLQVITESGTAALIPEEPARALARDRFR